MTCKCSKNNSNADLDFTTMLNELSWNISDRAAHHFLHDYAISKCNEDEQKALFTIIVHDILSRQSNQLLDHIEDNQLNNKQLDDIEGAAPI